jgi:hypothetical protein
MGAAVLVESVPARRGKLFAGPLGGLPDNRVGIVGADMVVFPAVQADDRFTLEIALSANQYQGCPSVYGAGFEMTSGFALD